MITLYLVRHGKKETAMGDVPLSAEGIEQARMTAAYFAGKSVDRVYSSPLRRARETADIIGLRLGLPVVVDDRLRERANWGDLPGQTFEEFVEMWDRCTRDREYEPLIGDSAKQAGARLESFALDLGRDGRSGSVVAVGHGGLITDFLTNVIVAEELERWHPRFAEVHGQLVAECSITRIECAEDRYGLTKLADVSHL